MKYVVNKALFWSFYVSFCTFCASLRLTRTVFSWLLKKTVSTAFGTKASLCGKSSLLEQSLPKTPSRPISLRPLWIFSLFRSLSAVALAKADAFCAFLWLINPRNLRNLCLSVLWGYPWLINDLRPCKALYICRDTSTAIESSLQINLFMQNKANFRKVKLNVNKVLTKDYVQMDTWTIGKTKPIKANKMPKQTQFILS